MIRAALVLSFLLLPGCAKLGLGNVSGEWDCDAQAGLGCVGIREADAAVTGKPPPPHARQSQGAEAGTAVAAEAGEPSPSASAAPFSRVREAEALARVWFYPFIDEGGHYHEGSFVHVVLRPAGWRADPEHMFPDMLEEALP